MICEQNPLSQIPVFPLSLSLSLSLRLFTSREASLNSNSRNHVALHIGSPTSAEAQSGGAYAMKMTQIWNKKGFHDSPLCRQAKWSVNMKARLSMKKKKREKHNHLRCFSDDGWMMKEQPGSEWRANTEWIRSLWKSVGRKQSCLQGVCVCVCVLTCSLITVQKGVWVRLSFFCAVRKATCFSKYLSAYLVLQQTIHKQVVDPPASKLHFKLHCQSLTHTTAPHLSPQSFFR